MSEGEVERDPAALRHADQDRPVEAEPVAQDDEVVGLDGDIRRRGRSSEAAAVGKDQPEAAGERPLRQPGGAVERPAVEKQQRRTRAAGLDRDLAASDRDVEKRRQACSSCR
jgi:hypothetical protein